MDRTEYYTRYHAGCLRIAKSKHRCSGCPLWIQPGEQYLDSNVTDEKARHPKIKRKFCGMCRKKRVL